MAIISYDDGTIRGTVECTNENVDEAVLKAAVDSLLSHLSSHVGTYNTPEVFVTIGSMKADFLGKVLRYIIEVGQAGGHDIPDDVRASVTGEVKCEWEPDEDERDDL